MPVGVYERKKTTYCRKGHKRTLDNTSTSERCFRCITCRKAARKKHRETHPWEKSFYDAMMRCTNKNNQHYHRYGDRGIKMLITKEDFKFLWFRDKAFEMKKPTIDRINNDGSYELSNCRFIEWRENFMKDNCGEKCYMAKFTNNTIRRIRKLYALGIKQHILVKQYNVSCATICRIVNNKAYANV